MKIEMGESLIFSWLKHVKKCQIVQTNWKPSKSWNLKNEELVERLIETAHQLFLEKYGYEINKGNQPLEHFIGQGEVDVVGMNFNKGQDLYAVNIAFHEAGLNYGSKDATVSKILQKCLRIIVSVLGYFDNKKAMIIFATPKIKSTVETDLKKCLEDLKSILNVLELDFQVEIIANQRFYENILEPILNEDYVAEPSELFVRSIQMHNALEKLSEPKEEKNAEEKVPEQEEVKIEVSEKLQEFEGMTIGAIVRNVLRKVLEDEKVSKEEVEQMQTLEYSKETFQIQYPLLQKVDLTEGNIPRGYYVTPLTIYGEEYYLCSDWFELPQNNIRQYLMKWLDAHL